MLRDRYSLVIANRTRGKLRQVTFTTLPAVVALIVFVGLPAGSLLLAQRDAVSEISRLRLQNARLELENTSYRAAAHDVASQMAALRLELTKLSGRNGIDPAMLSPVERLPDAAASASWQSATLPAAGSVLTRLRRLLGSIGDRLVRVRRAVAYREALAEAIPVMWPADGWISGVYGYRNDPFTGERDFHPAVDISSQKGQPVYATASGRVLSAARHGAYGNLVEIDHGFELVTRYGHLSEFAVKVGDTVQRGDVIGYVGATGRATGYHVHYEVWVGDRTVNPMRLHAESSSVAAN